MGTSPGTAPETANDPEPEEFAEAQRLPLEPIDDAYAQAELASRAERMERMVEKALESD